jgi:hypothetical protein
MLSIISKWLNNTVKEQEVSKVKQIETHCGLTWKQIYEDVFLIA